MQILRSARAKLVALPSTVVVLGLILRFVTLAQFAGDIDDPASLLAIKRTSELGYPLFPSGVLYLQGAVFSYLAAPFAWFLDSTALFDASRILHVCLASLIVPLSMKLVHMVTGNVWGTLLVGILVACDPTLIGWSVAIRPYGILAVAVTALLLLFMYLLRDGAEARVAGVRVVYLVPVVGTLGTFTHIGFWLVIPPLVLAGAIIWNRSLLTSNRAILIAGASLIPPLLAYFLLGRVSGAGTGDSPLGNSFVGSHLFSIERLREEHLFRWRLWTENFPPASFHAWVPFVIASMSAVIISAVWIRPRFVMDRWKANGIGVLAIVHLSSAVAVAALVSSDPSPRYLVHVIPVGYAVVAVGIWSIWRKVPWSQARKNIVQVGLVAVIVLPSLMYSISAASWRIEHPGASPDYWTAIAWVSDNDEEGQTTIIAMPPSAYFWYSETEFDQLMFLAGPVHSRRTERYIRVNSNGEPGDYWLGIAPIGSTVTLCDTLRTTAGAAWIVVDRGRLNADWAFFGQFQVLITGSSEERFRGHAGVMVRFVLPMSQWTREALSTCAENTRLLS